MVRVIWRKDLKAQKYGNYFLILDMHILVIISLQCTTSLSVKCSSFSMATQEIAALANIFFYLSVEYSSFSMATQGNAAISNILLN